MGLTARKPGMEIPTPGQKTEKCPPIGYRLGVLVGAPRLRCKDKGRLTDYWVERIRTLVFLTHEMQMSWAPAGYLDSSSPQLNPCLGTGCGIVISNFTFRSAKFHVIKPDCLVLRRGRQACPCGGCQKCLWHTTLTSAPSTPSPSLEAALLELRPEEPLPRALAPLRCAGSQVLA